MNGPNGERLKSIQKLFCQVNDPTRHLDQGEVDGSPSVLLKSLTEHLDAAGITRVGDLTGLDVIGIPVWFASRPNSRTLSVSQGKGLTPEHAKLSAIMESLEGAIAERPRNFVSRVCSLNELRGNRRKSINFKSIAACVSRTIDRDCERAWIAGLSLKTGDEVFAPYELVGTDFRVDTPWDHKSFRMSSVGLACGSTLASAVFHGLCEVVENDGSSLVELWPRVLASLPTLNFDACKNSELCLTIGSVRAAGFEVIFYDLTAHGPLPVIKAVVTANGYTGSSQYVWNASGYACRPNPETAALAALLEAVQTRCTEIAGSRDDIESMNYTRTKATVLINSHHSHATVGSSQKIELPPSCVISQLKYALDKLFDSGVEDVYVFPIGGETFGIHAARVLISDLDMVLEGGVSRFGPRGIRKMRTIGRSL